MNSLKERSSKGRAGFSLVEILVVILVIGIIAGIGIPMISSITGRSGDATNERQAQIAAAMATNALHAGNASLLNAGSKEVALEMLSNGVLGAGSFETVEFRVNLSLEEREGILPYLDYKEGLLVLNSTAP